MAEIIVTKCEFCATYLGGAAVEDDDHFGFIGEMVVEGLRDGLLIDLVHADDVTLGGHSRACPRRTQTAERKVETGERG